VLVPWFPEKKKKLKLQLVLRHVQIEGCILAVKCLQLVEDDLKFEAAEQKAVEAHGVGDIPVMDVDALSSIPAVHLTFDIIRCRVHIFSQLVEAWPECIDSLVKTQLPMVCILNIISSVIVNNFFVYI